MLFKTTIQPTSCDHFSVCAVLVYLYKCVCVDDVKGCGGGGPFHTARPAVSGFAPWHTLAACLSLKLHGATKIVNM